MSEISNPHDKFFKEPFSQLEVTGDFLQNYLPAPVLAQIDLNSIQLDKETFISPQLRPSSLWSSIMVQKSGRAAAN